MITDRIKSLPRLYTHVIGTLPRPGLQEESGMDIVSDGEWRRIHYTDEFLKHIAGFEPKGLSNIRMRSSTVSW